MSVAEPFLAAEEAALRASGLAAAEGLAEPRLYVERPTNAPKPYALHGQHDIGDDTTECLESFEVFSTVTVWAADDPTLKGRVRARRMGAAVRAALDAELAIAGYEVIEHDCESESYETDAAGTTRGELVFRYLIDRIAGA